MDRLVDPWQWGSNKMDLMSGWTWPHSIPRDLFKWTYWLTDYVWVIMGDPDTGTAPHTDPVLTAGWNSLLQGHKVDVEGCYSGRLACFRLRRTFDCFCDSTARLLVALFLPQKFPVNTSTM